MSDAKNIILNELENLPDTIDDEFQLMDDLYKLLKLRKSQNSVAAEGTLSTEEVRAHFHRQRVGAAMR